MSAAGDRAVLDQLAALTQAVARLTDEHRATRAQLGRLVHLGAIFYSAGRLDQAEGLPPRRFPT